MMAEIVLNIFHYLLRKICSSVIHGEYHSIDIKLGVEPVPYQIDGVYELAHSLKCVVLALNRHDNTVCRCHCVYREHVKRRRAIDDDKSIFIRNIIQFLL